MRFQTILFCRSETKKLEEEAWKHENGVFEEEVLDHSSQPSVVPMTVDEKQTRKKSANKFSF